MNTRAIVLQFARCLSLDLTASFPGSRSRDWIAFHIAQAERLLLISWRTQLTGRDLAKLGRSLVVVPFPAFCSGRMGESLGGQNAFAHLANWPGDSPAKSRNMTSPDGLELELTPS